MDPIELLTAIIEASIALIGFSGLVVVLGRRASGEWAPRDKDRLIILLGIGFILLACTLVALVLLSAGISHARVWALSSVLWVVLALPLTVWVFSRVFRVWPEQSPLRESTLTWTYVRVSIAVVMATVAVQVANAAYLAAFWPFLLGLAVLLVLGATQFFRLLWFGLFP
jgi:hypothetical protein